MTHHDASRGRRGARRVLNEGRTIAGDVGLLPSVFEALLQPVRLDPLERLQRGTLGKSALRDRMDLVRRESNACLRVRENADQPIDPLIAPGRIGWHSDDTGAQAT